MQAWHRECLWRRGRGQGMAGQLQLDNAFVKKEPRYVCHMLARLAHSLYAPRHERDSALEVTGAMLSTLQAATWDAQVGLRADGRAAGGQGSVPGPNKHRAGLHARSSQVLVLSWRRCTRR